jgi:hypothetical protein
MGLRAWIEIVCGVMLLAGCGGGGGSGSGSGSSGGGGGGGGGSTLGSVTISPNHVAVSAAVNAATPADVQLTVFTSLLPANAPYLGGHYSTNGITSVSGGWNASGTPVVDIVFKPPASLGPGSYTDQVQLQFCLDSACAKAIPGTGVTVPVTYQVTAIAAGTTPTVTFSQTQVSFQGLQIDPLPPPQVTIGIALANFGIPPYFTVSNGGVAVTSAQAYAQGLNTGTLTINLASPSSVPVGTTTVPLKITACLDPNCVTPVAGSPFTVTVNYVVGNSITVAGAQGYTLVPLLQVVLGMVWDPVHSLIYAGIPAGSNGSWGVAAIDPKTHQVGTPVALGATVTGAIDVSDDGQYLYVGLADGTVRRFQLPALTPDIVIPLGLGGAGNQLYARSVKVAPASPHSIAVALSMEPFASTADNEAGVVIFDDTVPRANRASATQNPAAGTAVDFLAWGATATTLYGTGTSLPGVFAMAVDSHGISAVTSNGSFAGTPLHLAGNLLYLDGGQVFDPGTGTVIDTLSAYTALYGVIPNAGLGKLFVSNSSIGAIGAPQLFSLNLSTRTPIASLLLPSMYLEQGDWLIASGGTLPGPVIVVSSTAYLAFITGGFVGP